MTTKKDGGPAFPRPKTPDHNSAQEGMSLRDWFAGQALAGLMASKAVALAADSDEIHAERERKAVSCFLLADALLAERSK